MYVCMYVCIRMHVGGNWGGKKLRSQYFFYVKSNNGVGSDYTKTIYDDNRGANVLTACADNYINNEEEDNYPYFKKIFNDALNTLKTNGNI